MESTSAVARNAAASAAASATTASLAATAAAASAVDVTNSLDDLLPAKVVSEFDPIGSALAGAFASQSIEDIVTSGRLSVAELDLKAPLASPTFTGDPKAPTPATADNDTSIATTAFVKAAIALLVDSSPATLDTLNELAAALGDDPNFATTMTNALAAKVPTARTVTAGTGLTGGGDLSANRTLAVDLADTAPLGLAAAAAVGVSNQSAREDHVHPAPAWQAYTPTLVSGTVGTGVGSITGRWCQIGKTVHFEAKWILGTGYVISNNTIIGTPTTRANTLSIYGSNVKCVWIDTPAGNLYWGIAIHWSGGISPYYMGANGLAGTVAPFTLSVGDEVHVAGTYESA